MKKHSISIAVALVLVGFPAFAQTATPTDGGVVASTTPPILAGMSPTLQGTGTEVGATETPAPRPSDQPAAEEKGTDPDDRVLLSGFRLGYSFVRNYDKPLPSLEGESLKDKVGLRSPHEFIIGYEAMYRMTGHSWLNVILVANVMIGGLEQSKFFPSVNGLIGFELKNSFQIAVGVHGTPLKGSEAHVALAAGWTPRVGSFYVPVHFFFVPDVDGAHRLGVTTGVTF